MNYKRKWLNIATNKYTFNRMHCAQVPGVTSEGQLHMRAHERQARFCNDATTLTLQRGASMRRGLIPKKRRFMLWRLGRICATPNRKRKSGRPQTHMRLNRHLPGTAEQDNEQQ